MGEAGIPEAVMQSSAGHLSKKMLDHYSHVRMAAKRTAVQSLSGGLIVPEPYELKRGVRTEDKYSGSKHFNTVLFSSAHFAR